MKIIDGKIVLETKPCNCAIGERCTPGKQPGRKVCPTCKGTRRGKRGGIGKCRGCYDGTTHDFENRVTCEVCKGAAIMPETRYDWITKELWESMTFRVVRDATGRWGFNESYLGLGYVSCCTDYGTAWANPDDNAIITMVKGERMSTQALNICREDLTVAKEMVIIVTKNGYKVKAVYGDENPADNSTADRAVKAMFDPRGLAMAEAYVAMETVR
jgi:hypothetical protein